MNRLKRLAASAILLALSAPAFAMWDSTTGPLQDTERIKWGAGHASIYGSGLSGASYFRIATNDTDRLYITHGGLVGIGIAPLSLLDINGGLAVGSYAGTVAAPSNGAIVSGLVGLGNSAPANAQLTIAPLNASTTGQVLTAATGQTADLVDVSTVGATVPTFAVLSDGSVAFPVLTKAVIDVFTPKKVGVAVICSNCTIPYSLCTSTGVTISGFARAGSATVGCGTSN